MSVEKLENGYLIATILRGTRVKRRYYGYSRADAIAKFKADIS
jgi:hypothetical protein